MLAALANLAFILTQQPDLEALQWKNRVLLLFAPDPADHRLQEQRRLLTDQEANLTERDLKVYQITGADGSANQLRQQFGVKPEEFALVLVGKDGGRKMKKSEPTPPTAIYGKIDAMPMRKSEMRRTAGQE